MINGNGRNNGGRIGRDKQSGTEGVLGVFFVRFLISLQMRVFGKNMVLKGLFLLNVCVGICGGWFCSALFRVDESGFLFKLLLYDRH